MASKYKSFRNHKNIAIIISIVAIMFLGVLYYCNICNKVKVAATNKIKTNNPSIAAKGTIMLKGHSDNEKYFPSMSEMILQTIQWRNNGIYMLDGKAVSTSLKQQMGEHIGNYVSGGCNYELYSMKGAETNKCIIVKNNQMYLKYDFLFADTIIFNGRTYVVGNSQSQFKKGKKIGALGKINAYEIEGKDSKKVIDVFLEGSSEAGDFKGDFTAYSNF